MEKKKQKKNFSGGFAECNYHSTRQRILKNKKQLKLCRVPELRHSAKIFFKKNISLPSVALGKEYKKNRRDLDGRRQIFSESVGGTR
jgi:hypothetical protein